MKILIGILGIVVVAVGVGYVVMNNNSKEMSDVSVTISPDDNVPIDSQTPPPNIQSQQQRTLTKAEAESLVVAKWNIDFSPQEGYPPQITISKNEDGTYQVVVTSPALDDSVSTTKFEGIATYSNGNWILSNPPVKTWACMPGRGHQNFSTDNCI